MYLFPEGLLLKFLVWNPTNSVNWLFELDYVKKIITLAITVWKG